MPNRISWKKGMRLTDEVLLAADQCTGDAIGQALMLGAAGRFGLYPGAPRPFELSLSVSKGYIDVETLSCLAITRGGDVIDAHFDTKFSSSTETRVRIPEDIEERELILTINAYPDRWQDTADGYSEPVYGFALVTPQKDIGIHAMPIARLVREDGWREDNSQFIPPCLYISSHQKLHDLYLAFVDVLRDIDNKTRHQLDTRAINAIRSYWPIVQNTLITVNTMKELMTPQLFLACVQKTVAAFTCACDMDEILTLEDADVFRNYVREPYSYRNAYLRTRQGIGMCKAISDKIDKFALLKEAPKPEPKPEPKPAPRPRSWNGPNI